MKEAAFYEELSDNAVRCHLCSHRCKIQDGRVGVCYVRKNIGGTLFTLVPARIISRHVDPIEKKPLYHFYPGSTAYSIASPGCNFRCDWCQNWLISQMPRETNTIEGVDVDAHQIVEAAQLSGSTTIAYTYTEPTVFFEYAYEIASIAHDVGINSIFVSDGYITQEALECLHPYLDAANIDLKSFRDVTYRHYIGARLQPVLDTLACMKQMGIWLEVTTLVIPGINDEVAEMRDIAEFIAGELGTGTPWHISRFYPNYKLPDNVPTPVSTLERAYEIGKDAGLEYVYVGNVRENRHNNTYCPGCGEVLIERRGYTVLANRINMSDCPVCGTPIAGVGLDH